MSSVVGLAEPDDDEGGTFDLMVAPDGVPNEVELLVDALNGARSINWSALDGELLAECRETVDRLANAMASTQAEFVRALDESLVWADRRHRSVKGLLRDATNASPGRQGEWTKTAGKLGQMPQVAAAFAAGLIGRDHVQLLGTCLHPRYAGAFADAEVELTRWAVEFDWGSFTDAVRAWQEAADTDQPNGNDERHQKARRLHHSRSFEGRGLLDATLTPMQAEIFDNVLRPIVDELFTADWADAVERLGEGNVTDADLARTPAQRRADAFEELCRRAAAWKGGIARPLVIIHASAEAIRNGLYADAGVPLPLGDGIVPELRQFSSGHTLGRRELVRALIDGKVSTMVLDDDHQILSWSRGKRWFTPVQRTAIAARDLECVCGCGLPADRCQIDHVVDWRFHGTTDHWNGRPMCPPSHRLKTKDPTWRPSDRPGWERGPTGPRLHRPGRGRKPSRGPTRGDAARP